MAARGSTRDRITEAAGRLFYRSGIRGVSVDAIAEKAGVTKKTLYYHFRSKDELIAAYVAARDQPTLEQFQAWFRAAQGGPGAGIEALFQNIAAAARHPKWRGCSFHRTAAELAELPGHPALKVGSAHKKKVEEWLRAEITAAGIADADRLACHIVLLLEGAFSIMLLHRNPAYAEEAGKAARRLLEQR